MLVLSISKRDNLKWVDFLETYLTYLSESCSVVEVCAKCPENRLMEVIMHDALQRNEISLIVYVYLVIN